MLKTTREGFIWKLSKPWRHKRCAHCSFTKTCDITLRDSHRPSASICRTGLMFGILLVDSQLACGSSSTVFFRNKLSLHYWHSFRTFLPKYYDSPSSGFPIWTTFYVYALHHRCVKRILTLSTFECLSL